MILNVTKMESPVQICIAQREYNGMQDITVAFYSAVQHRGTVCSY